MDRADESTVSGVDAQLGPDWSLRPWRQTCSTELQQLGIIRIDILQYQVRYVWMGGMDHTELEIDRLEDGSFRFIAHYNDYESEVIWPKRPNQSMQPTASRRAIQLCMSSTRQPDALRALARGSSSCSR